MLLIEWQQGGIFVSVTMLPVLKWLYVFLSMLVCSSIGKLIILTWHISPRILWWNGTNISWLMEYQSSEDEMLIKFDNRTFKTQLKSTSYCNMYVQSMLIEKQKTNRTKHKLGWCKIRIQNTYQQTKETYLHTIECSHCCLPFYQNYQTLKTQRSVVVFFG